jgi:hypothetical protein
VTQSEEDILTALILAKVTATFTDKYENRYNAKVSPESARNAAKQILSCGFSMARLPVDERQDQEIDDLERDVEQLRGWSGLPPELRR